MKILVSGGAGFLGSNLCEKLLAAGDEVVCVDNFITGNAKNIEHLKSNPHFRFEQIDVAKISVLDGLAIDRVYHMASPASPNKHSKKSYLALPFETMHANTNGTWILADFAQKHGAKFLFASTSEIYGDPLEHPQKEEYRGNVSTTGIRSVYDEAKRFGETITAALVRYKDLDGRIIRIFNTYGPKMDLEDGRAVIEFTTKALKNEVIPIFGDGSQTRSFCYVDDLVDGIIKAMESVGTKGKVFNLGNPEEFTILQLAEIVKKVTGSTSEIKFVESLPEDDPKRRKPDITRAKHTLGWEPLIGLEEGLARLVSYLKTPSA
jgi:nucleoside-diphosphate-sugar epimerase